VRKGDAVANSLFNIDVEVGTRRSKVETLGIIFDKCSHIMAYADDVIVMRIRLQDVEEVFTSLVETTHRMD
jgi:hypothetical protein